VVGWSRTSASSTLGFVWEDGQISYLDTLGGTSSSAADINNHGWIVGSSTLADGSRHGFLYVDGEMIDLNTLIDPASGIVLRDALSINDRGDILAYSATIGYVILSPVPEAGQWALLLTGLPMLAAVQRPARRRRAARTS
jgi:probable HAF family extracellular repeat protein